MSLLEQLEDLKDKIETLTSDLEGLGDDLEDLKDTVDQMKSAKAQGDKDLAKGLFAEALETIGRLDFARVIKSAQECKDILE